MRATEILDKDTSTNRIQADRNIVETPELYIDHREGSSTVKSLQRSLDNSDQVTRMGELQLTIQRVTNISSNSNDQIVQLVRDPRLQTIIDTLSARYDRLESRVAVLQDGQELETAVFEYVEALTQAELDLTNLLQQGDFDQTEKENRPMMTRLFARQITRKLDAFQGGTLVKDIRASIDQRRALQQLEFQWQALQDGRQLDESEEEESEESSDEKEELSLEEAMLTEQARLLGTGIHKNLLYRDFFVKPMAEGEVEAEFRGNLIMSLFIDNEDTLKLPGFKKHKFSKAITTDTGRPKAPKMKKGQEVLVTGPASGENFTPNSRYSQAEISSIAELAVYDYVANIGDRMASQKNHGNVMVDSEQEQVTAVDNSVSRNDILRSGSNLNQHVRKAISRFVGRKNYMAKSVEAGIARALVKLRQVLAQIEQGAIPDISVIIGKKGYEAKKFAGMGKSEHLISKRIVIVLKALKTKKS